MLTMGRRLWVLLIALMLALLALANVKTAYAEEVDSEEGAACVLYQGDEAPRYFSDIQSAIDVLPENGSSGDPDSQDFPDIPSATVQLTNDVDLGGEYLRVDKMLTLDLNGHCVTGPKSTEQNRTISVTALTSAGQGVGPLRSIGILTIADSSEDGSGRIVQGDDATGPTTYVVEVDADRPNQRLTIEGGTIEGSIPVRDGRANTHVTISGGTLVGRSIAVQMGAGNLTITGNPSIQSAGVGVQLSDTDAVIDGGTIKATDAGIRLGDGTDTSGGSLTIGDPSNDRGPSITGSPSVQYRDGSATCKIENGHFSDDAANKDDRICRRDDLKLMKYVEDGNTDYSLQPYREFVCLLSSRNHGPEAYTSLGAAQEAVSVNDVDKITLIDDVDLGEDRFTTTKKYCLDLNGHTISGSDPEAVIAVTGIVYLVDSKSTGAVRNNASNSHGIAVSGFGILDVRGGTIDAPVGIISKDPGSKVVIQGGFIGRGTSGASVVNENPETSKFEILDGAFSDDAGNHRGFRLHSKTLAKSDDGWYRLADADTVCTNCWTGFEYTSLQKALDDAEQLEEIKLTADCSTDVPIDIRKDITLDLAGHHITSSKEGLIITKNVIFTLKDSSADGSGVIESTGDQNAGIKMYAPECTLIIQGGTIKGANGVVGFNDQETTRLEMTGGSIVAEMDGIQSDGVVIISGNPTIAAGAHGVYTRLGDVQISGGTIEGTTEGTEENDFSTGIAVCCGRAGNRHGKVTITGGNFIGNPASVWNANGPDAFIVNGGRYSCGMASGGNFMRPEGKTLRTDPSDPHMFILADED